MEINFRFAVGDIVRHVVSANQKQTAKLWVTKTPDHDEIRMIILRRHYSDTGPSQVDIGYDCRPIRFDGSMSELISFDEIELVASEPFPDSPCEQLTK